MYNEHRIILHSNKFVLIVQNSNSNFMTKFTLLMYYFFFFTKDHYYSLCLRASNNLGIILAMAHIPY